MLIELHEPFKSKYRKGYLVTNKENRKHIVLYNSDKDRTTISYARYLMGVKLGAEVPKEYEVDHRDDNKTNDAVDNLQLLTPKQNREKRDRLNPARRLWLTCPICEKVFLFPLRDLPFRKNPTCSRVCGGRLGHPNTRLNRSTLDSPAKGA